MTNGILRLVFVALIARRDVFSLKCYSCDSNINPSCGRQFDSTKVDSCSGNFCWINETWKGAASYPPPADVSITSIRACANSSSIYFMVNTNNGVYYTETCSDRDYCNGPPPSSSNSSIPMSCYFCSGDGCSVPLANMAKCNGPSCYKEVSNSKAYIQKNPNDYNDKE
ncbi:hypothetical protein HELRODRAFT_178507 [Helobdella robusta]|uniref:Protein sleepless n=1 Tax=Helobdella robusta TaxID=6412 RepID=T1FDA0_HELRO|nr:hypothetical protein HELRODRAFT_178507 [Helobdella robusta]ESN97058.1 hypothetical protein HELRODRAFT_178507 [Helobdella robusta]